LAKKPTPKWWIQPFDEHDQRALKALWAGTATDAQQKIAIKWIIQKAARTFEISHQPDSQRASDFAEGRRSVGLQITALIEGPMIEKLKA
jgi:hypothetical protein